MDAVAHRLGVVAGAAAAADEFDLQVIQRVNLGHARTNDRGEIGVGLKQPRLAADLQ